jgi:hypothetical protein
VVDNVEVSQKLRIIDLLISQLAAEKNEMNYLKSFSHILYLHGFNHMC